MRFFAVMGQCLLLAILAATLTSEPTLASNGAINLIIYNCTAYANQVPTVQLGDSYVGQYRVIKDVPTRSDSGVYKVTVPVSGRHFWVRVSAGLCHTTMPVGTVPGHTRTIVAFPNKSILVSSSYHWIAGELPKGIGAVQLVLADSYRTAAVATIDDGCYYLEFLEKGNYLIRFLLPDAHVVDVPVRFGDSGVSGLTMSLTSQMVLDAIH